MARPRPLATRLRAARTLLREWRRTVYDSQRCRVPGPELGEVDAATAHELARFDEAYAALTEAIKLLKTPAMRSGAGLTTCDMHDDESY